MGQPQSSGINRRSKWLMLGALIAAVLMGVGRLGAGLLDTPRSPTVPEPDCSAAISWNSASNYEGEEQTVHGPVVGVNYVENVGGTPTFVNLGRDHPDPNRFTVVIWRDVREQFDQPPELLFAGREICVAGDVRMYEGSPQIELVGPGAIRFTGDKH